MPCRGWYSVAHKQDHAELVTTILTGARWATVLRLAAQILSWLSTIIVVRFISPEDYGLNAMLASPLTLMMLFSTLGLDAALVQAKNIDPDELQSVFGGLLIVNGILFLAYFFGGAAFAVYFDQPRLALLAKALAFTFLLVPFRVIPNALLDRQLDFKLRAQLEISATISAAVLTLALAYLGAGVWALVAGVVVSKLLLSMLLMLFKPWFVFPRFNLEVTGKIMSVGGMVTASNLLALLSDMLVTLVGGPKLGAQRLGVFGVSADFASLPLSKGMPIINQTMLPAFSRLQDHRDSATYYFAKLLGVTSLAFVPMLVGLACIADTLVLTVLGSQWELSILPLKIMSVGMVFRMNSQLLKTVMTSMGRTDLVLISNALQLVLLLPVTIYAVEYGVLGVTIAWALAELVMALALIRLSQSSLDTSLMLFVRCYRPAFVSSAIMGIFVLGIETLHGNLGGMAALLLDIATGVLAYYIAVRWFFVAELRTALKAVFGDRFAFLAGRPTNN